MADTVTDAESTRDELFRINLGLWNHAKNHNPATKERNARGELVWLNYVPGVRESRRLLGPYVMSQVGFDTREVHQGTIAFADWGPGVHHSGGTGWPGTTRFMSARDAGPVSATARSTPATRQSDDGRPQPLNACERRLLPAGRAERRPARLGPHRRPHRRPHRLVGCRADAGSKGRQQLEPRRRRRL